MTGSAGQPQPLVVGVAATLTGFVARGLARAGMRPVVLGWNRPLPVGRLPGCRRHVAWEGVRWEDGELALEAAQHVDETCRALGLDVVVAADYDAVLLLGRAPPPRTARVAPLPAPDVARALHDKWRLSGLLRELGVPGPESELARSAADLEGTRLPFPLSTRPVDKWGGLGFQVHATPAGLRRAVARGLDAPFPLLVQPFVPGLDVGFSFLARRGRLLACSMFLHVRDGERRFFDDPVLRRHGERLLEATGYDGVGHVDARRDPSGGYHLLELNPRFWASLPYAVEAGVNYPDLLVRADEVAAGPVRTARPGPVSLGLAERSLALAVRWWERACVAARRLGERRRSAARAWPGPR